MQHLQEGPQPSGIQSRQIRSGGGIDLPSKFVKVKCNDCENEQVIFAHASTVVKCLVCGRTLAEPTGGKADIKTTIVEVLE
ncbi:MAG: 30S ribosomal protein S27e [Methanothrix sp.]|nr:30S ribosomal protein S27e [Methanothrix sp.]